MQHLLNNPVFNSLISRDLHLGSGSNKAKYFHEEISPFAGIEEGYAAGFDELSNLLPHGRIILYAIPGEIPIHSGWDLLDKISGLQLIYNSKVALLPFIGSTEDPIALQKIHVDQMMELASLTKPGPFGPRTIDFGNYFGIFNGEKLVAMAGQRLHVQQYSEISAVCTHPNYLGRGYAGRLVRHQIQLILSQNQVPYLHVRDDNKRAIELYQRIGFKIRSNMNFYVLKKS